MPNILKFIVPSICLAKIPMISSGVSFCPFFTQVINTLMAIPDLMDKKQSFLVFGRLMDRPIRKILLLKVKRQKDDLNLV